MPPFFLYLALAAITAVLYPFVHDFLSFLFRYPIDWVGWLGAHVQSLQFKFYSALLSFVLAAVLWVVVRTIASIPGEDPRKKEQKK